LERHGGDIHAKNTEGEGLAEKAVALAEDENEAMVTFLFNRGFIPVDFRLTAQDEQEQEEGGNHDDEGEGEADENDAQMATN